MAALRFAIDREDRPAAARMVAALAWYWSIRSQHVEACTWADAVLALPGEADPASEICLEALSLTGILVLASQETPITCPSGRDRWTASSRSGTPTVRAPGRRHRAGDDGVLRRDRRPGAAAGRATAGRGSTINLMRLVLLDNEGRVGEIVELLEPTIDGFRELGDRWGLAMALSQQGDGAVAGRRVRRGAGRRGRRRSRCSRSSARARTPSSRRCRSSGCESRSPATARPTSSREDLQRACWPMRGATATAALELIDADQPGAPRALRRATTSGDRAPRVRPRRTSTPSRRSAAARWRPSIRGGPRGRHWPRPVSSRRRAPSWPTASTIGRRTRRHADRRRRSRRAAAILAHVDGDDERAAAGAGCVRGDPRPRRSHEPDLRDLGSTCVRRWATGATRSCMLPDARSYAMTPSPWPCPTER